VLISFLQQEGHVVMSPRAVSMRGVEDTAHLSYATVQQCAVVTANVREFLWLHQTWQQEGRPYAGILALYRENHPRRDMTYAQIVQAVSRLQRPGLPLYNTFHNLNMWREPSRRERLGDLRQNGDHAVVWIF
jgi:Domain of unknown function (DUF5615)